MGKLATTTSSTGSKSGKRPKSISPFARKSKARRRLLRKQLALAKKTAPWMATLPFPPWADSADFAPAVRSWAKAVTKGKGQAALLVPLFENGRPIRANGPVFTKMPEATAKRRWALMTGAEPSDVAFSRLKQDLKVSLSQIVLRALASTNGNGVVVTGSLESIFHESVAGLPGYVTTDTVVAAGTSPTSDKSEATGHATSSGEQVPEERTCQNCGAPIGNRPRQSRYCDKHSPPAARKRYRTAVAKKHAESDANSSSVHLPSCAPNPTVAGSLRTEPKIDVSSGADDETGNAPSAADEHAANQTNRDEQDDRDNERGLTAYPKGGVAADGGLADRDVEDTNHDRTNDGRHAVLGIPADSDEWEIVIDFGRRDAGFCGLPTRPTQREIAVARMWGCDGIAIPRRLPPTDRSR